MKIPFIEHTGIGLHITEQVIRWVQISRLKDKISITKAVRRDVQRTDPKFALQKLVNEIGPSYPYVIANIPFEDLHQAVLELPFKDGEGYLEEWLNEAPKQFIPEGYNSDEFYISHHLFGGEEQTRLCYFTLAHKEAVENRVKLLKSVGLRSVAITPGNIETGYGMMFDTSFVNGNTMLLKAFEDSCCLIEYQNGLASNFYPLPKSNNFNGLVEEAESLVISRLGYGESTSANEIYSVSSNGIDYSLDQPSRIKVHQISPLSNFTVEDEQLSADYAVACGLAVKAVYPALDTVNLMEEEDVEGISDSIEKKDAIVTGSVLGGGVVFLWLLVSVIQWNLSGKNQDLQRQINLMQDKITAVASERKRVKKMKGTVSDARNLVSDQTSMVRYLESIGRIFKNGIWLQSLALKKSDSGIPHITLLGYAHNESSVSELLADLEKQKKIKKVRLVYSRKKETDDIFSKNIYSEKKLILYEIQVQTVR